MMMSVKKNNSDNLAALGTIEASPSASNSKSKLDNNDSLANNNNSAYATNVMPNGMPSDEEIKTESLVDNDHLDERPRHHRPKSVVNLENVGIPPKINRGLEKFAGLFRSKKSLRAKVIEDAVDNAPLHAFGDEKTPMFIRRLMKDAHAGDIEAQFTLGYCYDVGTAIKPETNEAIFWYTKAADKGHAIAQNNLGVIYSTGHRGLTKKDWAEALHWYIKASEHNNPNAQFHAGLAYMNGEGVEARDDSQAFIYFKKAAKSGHSLAQSNVGAMYMGGRGVTKNYKKAFKWLKKAAAKEDAVALHNIGVMYIKGFGVIQDADLGEGYIRRASTGKNAGIIPKDLSLLTKKNGATLYNS